MKLNHKEKFIGKIIFNTYKIKKSFGKVFLVSNIKTNGLYAAKLVCKNNTNINKYLFFFFIVLGKKG